MSPTTAEMLQKRHLNRAQVVMVYFADIAAAKHTATKSSAETNRGQEQQNTDHKPHLSTNTLNN